MKCLCGYEHKSGFDDSGKWEDNLKGREHFLLVSKAYIEDCEGIQERKLYACPVCGTVKLASSWEAD